MVVAEPRYVAAAAAARPAAQITFHGDPPPVVPKVGDYGQLSRRCARSDCRRTSLASSRPQRPTARDVLGPEPRAGRTRRATSRARRDGDAQTEGPVAGLPLRPSPPAAAQRAHDRALLDAVALAHNRSRTGRAHRAAAHAIPRALPARQDGGWPPRRALGPRGVLVARAAAAKACSDEWRRRRFTGVLNAKLKRTMHAILAGAVEEVLGTVGRLHRLLSSGLPAREAHLDAGLRKDVEAVRERRHRHERAARRLAAKIIER